MKSKRFSTDEQFRLIMECRQSGLSDYQWCKVNDINPSTFYNWINRNRKRGITLPMSSDQVKKISAPLQEVVKIDLVPDLASVPAPMQVEQNTCIDSNLATRELPAVEILIGNATIRFFNSTDKSLIEATLGCIGGVMVC
ncbi:MAG: transposase [Mobilitalea sp.]